MKIKQLIKRLSSGLIVGLLFLNTTGSALAAFGVSPAYIQYDYLKPGTTYTQTLILSTDNPNKERIIKTTVTGDEELKNWITFEPAVLSMPTGKKQVPLKVNFVIPSDAEEGNYSGNIAVAIQSKNNKDGLDINLGGNIKVDLNVTDKEFIDYSIRSFGISPMKEGHPLFVELTINNKSNVTLDSLPVTAEIWSIDGNRKIAAMTEDVLRYPIAAYSEGITEVEIPLTELPAGQYWANIKAYQNNQVIFESKAFLDVEPVITPTSAVQTSLTVRGKDSLRASSQGTASIGTSLRVKSPYEDVLIYSSVILLALIVVGVGYKRFYKK